MSSNFNKSPSYAGLRYRLDRSTSSLHNSASFNTMSFGPSASTAFASIEYNRDDDNDDEETLDGGEKKDPTKNMTLKEKIIYYKNRLFSKNGSLILVLIVSIIFISAFDWLMWKKALNRFHALDRSSDKTLSFYVFQLYSLVMLCLSGIALLICKYGLKNIDPETTTVRQIKLVGMSGFDSLSVMCSSLAAPVVQGHIQTILNYLVFPLTMLFSIIVLTARYVVFEYVGAVLILAGALTAAVPSVNHDNNTRMWGVIVYCLGSLPYACGNVYREWLFKSQKELNIFFLMFWTSLYQFSFSMLSLPITNLSIFGGTPFNEIPHIFRDGFKCMIGREVEGFGCHIGWPPGAYLAIYIALNFILSILRLMIVKHASALMLQVTNALALIASNLLFCIPFLMGDDVETFHYYDAIGFVMVFIGFVMFRYGTHKKEKLIEEEIQQDIASDKDCLVIAGPRSDNYHTYDSYDE